MDQVGEEGEELVQLVHWVGHQVREEGEGEELVQLVHWVGRQVGEEGEELAQLLHEVREDSKRG